jgi:hypothetical protein
VLGTVTVTTKPGSRSAAAAGRPVVVSPALVLGIVGTGDRAEQAGQGERAEGGEHPDGGPGRGPLVRRYPRPRSRGGKQRPRGSGKTEDTGDAGSAVVVLTGAGSAARVSANSAVGGLTCSYVCD